MQATLSILGLYNLDESVMEGLEVPEGLDRDTLISYIFMECADLELLYPQLPIMKRLIKAWADARAHSWERLYQSTVQKYNMIHNYDRYEDWTDIGSRSVNGTSSGSSHGTASTRKAAYNTGAGLTLTDQQDSTGNSNANSTETTADHQTRSGHLYGNIGVTTAAQMLTSERELYKWDVYGAIAQEFKERFCILVY